MWTLGYEKSSVKAKSPENPVSCKLCLSNIGPPPLYPVGLS